jgi:HAD superfamily hydrolase (TIGR01509 family)
MYNWFAPIWKDHRDVSVVDQLHFLIGQASQGEIKLHKKWLPLLIEAYASALFEHPPMLNPHTTQVLSWLKQHEKKIGIICNTGRTPGFALRRYLEEQGVSTYFTFMLFSDEVGTRKPNPQIFHLAIQHLDLRPNEVVHIGDNIASDIAGAKIAGWRAIHFLTEQGHDSIADADPHSLTTLSRSNDTNTLSEAPDYIVSSLDAVIPIIKRWDNQCTTAAK